MKEPKGCIVERVVKKPGQSHETETRLSC